MPLNDLEDLEKVAEPINKLPGILNGPDVPGHQAHGDDEAYLKIYKVKNHFRYFMWDSLNWEPVAWWNMDAEV